MENETLAASEASRAAALKEAAWYRSKLAAFERDNPSEVAKLEHERTVSIESQLSRSLREKVALERQLASMREQVKLETLLRVSTDERLTQTSKRAMAAEEAQMRVHEQISTLQKRSYAAESTLREQTERAVTLSGLLERERADHEQTRTERDEATNTAAVHGDSLIHLKAALGATSARADEHQRLYSQHRDLVETHQQTVNTLQTQLDQRNQEAVLAEQRISELEWLLVAAEAEANAHRLASTDGLTQVMQTRNLTAQRSADAALPAEVEDKIRALEEEVVSLQEMHIASRRSVDEATGELVQVRERNMSLQKQHAGLQSELDVVRAQLAIALQELARLKDKLVAKSVELHERTRRSEGTSIKLQLLKEHMVESGLPPPTDRDEPIEGGIEAQLVALQREADEGTRAAAEARTKLADANLQIDTLQRELARGADQAALDEVTRRAEMSERELAGTTASYKERMVQLENDYYAAVSFVKGCEKMLRTMRTELSRTKQENGRLLEEVEQLRASAAGQTRSGSTLGDRTEDIAALQTRLASISQAHQDVALENRDLERRMAALISEQKEAYDRSRGQLDATAEADRRAQGLEGQVASLEDALAATREELQNTLTLNQHLTRELASGDPAGPGRTLSPVA